jgi:zinc/manganese transport system ATP-binding protein
MGLWRRLGPWRSARRHRATLLDALAAVGLAGFEARLIGTLSGGQFQRALFARLIVQEARVLLLDEPFTGVDGRTTADLLALVRAWHGQGRTIVAALHDLGQVRSHFPHTLLLARERVAWGPTERVLTPQNLARAQSLSEAWDEDAAVCGRHEEPGPPHDHDHDHDHSPDHDHGPDGRHAHPHAHDHGAVRDRGHAA